MKRCLFVLLLLLILSGCNGKDQQIDRVMEFRQRLNSGSGCAFDAYITADYGDKLYTFTLQCQTDGLGNLDFSVLDPQSIAGITGTVSAQKGALTFDNQVLAFSLLADGQMTPVSAPWLLIKTLRGGYIRGCGQEDTLMRAVIDDTYEEETMQLDIWFDENDHPVYADFLWQGRRIIAMEVKNFQHL